MWGRGGEEAGELGEAEVCEFCFGGSQSLAVPLSEEAVELVERVLLLPPKAEEEEAEGIRKAPLLCEECASSLTALTDLYFHLEDVRGEFNGLRRRLGSRLILRKLGGSQGAVEEWEEQLKGVEHLFPSALTRQPIGGQKTGDRQMPPLRRMAPLKDAAGETAVIGNEAAEVVENQIDVVEGESSAAVDVGVREIEVICIDDSDEEGEKEENRVAEVDVPQKTSKGKFSCQICCMTFTRKGGLLSHIGQIHNSARSEERHQCSECASSYSRKSDLRQHERRVHGLGRKAAQVPIACPSCSKVFFTRSGLKRHQRSKHVTQGNGRSS